MKFCFDLDDVIAETYSEIMIASEHFHTYILGRNMCARDVAMANGDYFYFAKALNWDNTDVYRFFHEEYPLFLEKCKVKRSSVSAIKTLYDQGHKITILSAREERKFGQVYFLTEDWLKRNEVKYNELIIGEKKKSMIVSANEYDVFVDDSIINCIDVAENSECKVYFFRCKYNAKVNIGSFCNIKEIDSLQQLLR